MTIVLTNEELSTQVEALCNRVDTLNEHVEMLNKHIDRTIGGCLMHQARITALEEQLGVK